MNLRFWPPDNCEPLPPTWVLKPSGKDSMNSRMFALRHASLISSSVTSDAGLVAPSRMLKRTVPAYSVYR